MKSFCEGCEDNKLKEVTPVSNGHFYNVHLCEGCIRLSYGMKKVKA